MIKKISLFLIAALLIFSCNPYDDFINPDVAAADLQDVDSVLAGIQGSMSVVEKDLAVSRALSPSLVPSDTENWVYDAGVLTPAAVFAKSRDADSLTDADVVTIPPDVSSYKYFNDYYNTGDQAYFTIEKEGLTANYRIKLYIYPTTDFNTNYVFEEYIVDGASTTWTTFNENGTSDYLIRYETHYADGRIGSRNVLANSGITTVYYEQYTAPAVFTDQVSLDEYIYPSPLPVHSDQVTGAGTWSACVETIIPGRRDRVKAFEFYTENNADHSGVSYIETRTGRGRNKIVFYTVTRFTEDATSKNIQALTTKAAGGYTELNTVDISETGGIVSIDTSTEIWYENPGTVLGGLVASRGFSSFSTEGTELSLSETSVDSGEYSGVVSKKHGSRLRSYNVTVTKANGKVNYSQTDKIDSDVTFDVEISEINDIIDIIIDIDKGKGKLEGTWENGAFIGTYKKGKKTVDVFITMQGIEVNGIFYPFDGITDF